MFSLQYKCQDKSLRGTLQYDLCYMVQSVFNMTRQHATVAMKSIL